MQAQGQKLKVVVMSDTHDNHHKINIQDLPKADIFIHSGDFTKRSAPEQLARFRQFLTMLPYKYKVIIAGNHDFTLDKKYVGAKQLKGQLTKTNTQEQIKKIKQVCIYLQHETVEIEGLVIFGSPYSLEFYDWGFMHTQNEADNLWKSIPEKVDIVITHGPPFGVLDQNMNKKNTGCKSLLQKIKQVRAQYHIFGHIHESYGREQHQHTTFINASTCNFAYKPVNKPIVFEISPLKNTK